MLYTHQEKYFLSSFLHNSPKRTMLWCQTCREPEKEEKETTLAAWTWTYVSQFPCNRSHQNLPLQSLPPPLQPFIKIKIKSLHHNPPRHRPRSKTSTTILLTHSRTSIPNPNLLTWPPPSSPNASSSPTPAAPTPSSNPPSPTPVAPPPHPRLKTPSPPPTTRRKLRLTAALPWRCTRRTPTPISAAPWRRWWLRAPSWSTCQPIRKRCTSFFSATSRSTRRTLTSLSSALFLIFFSASCRALLRRRRIPVPATLPSVAMDVRFRNSDCWEVACASVSWEKLNVGAR